MRAELIERFVGGNYLCGCSLDEGLKKNPLVQLGAVSSYLAVTWSVSEILGTLGNVYEPLGDILDYPVFSVSESEITARLAYAACVVGMFACIYFMDQEFKEARYSKIGPQYTGDYTNHCPVEGQIKDFFVATEDLGLSVSNEEASEGSQNLSRKILNNIDSELAQKVSIGLFWQCLIEELRKKNLDLTEGFDECDFTQNLDSLNRALDDWMQENETALEKITELEWREKHFIILPYQIGELKNLKRLSLLGNNLLKEVPESIGNLSNLLVLRLMGTQLTSLPDSIGNLENLRILAFSCGGLQQLPESIGNLLNLCCLSVGINQLKQLPDSFCKLQRLEDFALNQNPFEDLDHIKRLVRKLPALRKCDVYPESTTNILRGLRLIGMGASVALAGKFVFPSFSDWV